ncbi:MAG: 3-hydroxyacyl-[acyl-carrier-protein] dehydratase FabZ, partial [Proteobacteria bacterium]|nr:3-hydroxyacyl-[acyl-carrier-protein] dehydratase FabZ [Pseudomonadota bacterium]
MTNRGFMSEFDIKKVMDYLPHRYPFLLIDRVIDMEAGAALTALKNVSVNEPFLQEHFPGQPVMP